MTALPSTSISGGEIASIIVAATGVGYFVLTVIRKPISDSKMLARLSKLDNEKGRLQIQLQQCRELVRSLRARG